MWKLIIAHTESFGIGYKGDLPWPKLTEDMRRFRQLTLGNVVIMGRKTFDSIGQVPLPSRITIVMTRDGSDKKDKRDSDSSVFFCSDKSKALAVIDSLQTSRKLDVCVCGGADIYEMFAAHCTEIYSTVVETPYKTDVYYTPTHHQNCVSSETLEENGIRYHFKDSAFTRSVRRCYTKP